MAAIITDSTSDLTLMQAEELGVTMLSLRVNFGNEVYLDKRTLSNDEFYEKLAAAKELPTTSLLNPDDFIEAFNDHPDEEIVVLTLSQKLSGTYQSAVLAKETIGREDIYIVDTENVTAALGLIVRLAADMNKKGLGAEKIAAEAARLSKKLRLMGVVDTLKYLVKGGRLNKVSGYLGGVLHIKPVLMINEGAVEPVAKARGDRGAFEEIRKLVFEKHPIDTAMPVAFGSSAGGYDRLDSFMETLGLTGEISTIGSVVGTHAGPGVVMIAYFEQ